MFCLLSAVRCSSWKQIDWWSIDDDVTVGTVADQEVNGNHVDFLTANETFAVVDGITGQVVESGEIGIKPAVWMKMNTSWESKAG